MSTVTVVPTVEASHVPPRVKLDVTDTGAPNLFAATITRLDPSGEIATVRTNDGNPLTLTTSGSNRIGTVYDYEMPLGAPISYSSVESPTTISAEVTVADARVWLVHPGVPELSQSITVASFGPVIRRTARGVFYPMGRKYPVVQTDGARKGSESMVELRITTLTELANLNSLLADSSPLLLNVPYTLPWGVAPRYISIDDTRENRLIDYAGDPNRYLELPYITVDRPLGGTQAERTYVDLLDYSTYASLQAAYPSYTALLAGP